MTKDAIDQYLDELEHRLLNQSAEIAIELDSTWALQFANRPAVYIFKENNTIAHVGETKHFKAQMMELLSTKYAYNNAINELLNVAVKHLKLSYIEVDLGRKELQERILDRIANKTYTKTEKQQAHKNAYERWTEEEDGRLERLFCEGKTIKELITIFERNEGAIKSRIKKLELREKYDR